jgi:3-methyladenine DNA glycosylase AlkD
MNKELETRLKKEENPTQAKLLQGFFKTGIGQYGEGDIFLGIKVPVQRIIAKEFSHIGMEEVQVLLNSKIHEKRMIALFILIMQYKQAGKEKNFDKRKEIFYFYLKNYNNINNWDLVDLSAPNIVGDFLLDKKAERKILYDFANSDNLWKKRIAILASFTFIREREFEDSLKISEMLSKDKHDLIHKAVGWMLREIGKRDLEVEEKFLNEDLRYKNMPRTMLRYAIEKFEEGKRKKYLNGDV